MGVCCPVIEEKKLQKHNHWYILFLHWWIIFQSSLPCLSCMHVRLTFYSFILILCLLFFKTLQPVQELLKYLRFGLWWLVLGVASSIGLGEWTYAICIMLYNLKKPVQCILINVRSVQCSLSSGCLADSIVFKSQDF